MRIAAIDWRMDLRFREQSFRGTVSFEVEDATRGVQLDASRLVVDSVRWDGHPAEFRQDEARGTLSITGSSAGAHRVEVAYHGVADRTSLVGLYVSPCGLQYALTTMLFPTGSSRLLPTLEHPSMKSVYRLELTVDPDVKVVFNTEPVAERTTDGRRVVTFRPTPPMSAYLLYLGVGPFDTLTLPGERWSVTVAASPGRATAGTFCAERTVEILAAYEQYYGVDYPLSKLDLVALENFWAGAMENWGAIAFRESVVTVDPSTSVRERQVILLVLAHEIAHQWFGNLVTPADWDDFWLNESFATFVGHRLVASRYPEADGWSYFMIRHAGRALDEDSRPSTHPVHMPVKTPDELGEVSDDVTYGKGAAVLRMIEAYIGEAAFRRGVSRYLQQHRFANARAKDLWDALAEESNLPVDRVMTEWITRPGYPVVSAEWSNGTLRLRQERFAADGAFRPETWPIPLRVVSSDGVSDLLFEGPAVSIAVSSPEGLRVDPGRTAFARVHYDDALFRRMLEEFPSMSPVDQWGLAADTVAFVYAGTVPLSRFLDLLEAGGSISSVLPVYAFAIAVNGLHRFLFDSEQFVTAARKFLREHLKAVGLSRRPGEPDAHQYLREILSESLVWIDDELARELAPQFARFDELPSELRVATALAFARTNGPAAYEPLRARWSSSPRHSEREQMLDALGAFRDPESVRRSLDEVVLGPEATSTTAFEFLFQCDRNPAAGPVLFDWYRERAGVLAEKFAGTPLLSMSLQVTLPIMGVDRESEVVRFFHENVPSEARLGVARGLEVLELGMRLRKATRRASAG